MKKIPIFLLLLLLPFICTAEVYLIAIDKSDDRVMGVWHDTAQYQPTRAELDRFLFLRADLFLDEKEKLWGVEYVSTGEYDFDEDEGGTYEVFEKRKTKRVKLKTTGFSQMEYINDKDNKIFKKLITEPDDNQQ